MIVDSLKRSIFLMAALLLTMVQGARAQFITDVKVIGHKNEKTITGLRDSYRNQGWTIMDKDLNDGAGGAYIFLMYKTGSSNGITGFYLRVSGKNDSPDNLTFEGRTYYRADYDGSDGFKNAKGDLNNEAGGSFIHLYYTRDAITAGQAVYRVCFDGNSNSAVGENGGSGACDLNKGSGGKYIYMHVSSSAGGRESVSYVRRSWDSGTATVRQETRNCSNYTWLEDNASGINTKLGDGWYVVDKDVTFNKTIQVVGNANIILVDGKKLTAQNGVSIQADKTLTIYGQSGDTGTLYAHAGSGPGIGGTGDILAGHFVVHGGNVDAESGSDNNAGIGGGNGGGSGIQSVTIYGGTVTAQGGSSAAGIGKGQQNNHWEVITIYGGTVKAKGGNYGAGIGGGEDRGNGTVTIWGGHVEATGGWNGAGIGGGEKGDQDRPITINGGYVKAVGNADSAGHNGGAGIGGGYAGNGGTLTINGGTVYAYGRRQAAGIGGGSEGSCGNVTINEGDVYAKCEGSPRRGAGIGGGYKASQGGDIIINGGAVNAETAEGAGIGGGFKGHGGRIVITDGLVTAKSKDGAGIGGGSSMDGGGGGNGGNVTISGGVVLAFSEKKGAGIGGGNDGDGGTVNISGGHVTAAGGQYDTDYWQDQMEPDYLSIIKKFGGRGYHNIVLLFLKELVFSGDWGGAGIGGGDDGDGGKVNITGGTVIAHASNAYAIGRGDGGGTQGTLSLYDEAEVLLVKDEETVYVDAPDRISTCQWSNSVIVTACDHAQHFYTIDDAHGTHTLHCSLCYYTLTEEHQLDELGNCVCGFGLGTCEISVYVPAEQADGSFDCRHYVIGKTMDFRIPVETPRSGTLQFEGWMLGTPADVDGYEWREDRETLVAQDGILHNVTANTSLIARYKEYWSGNGTGAETDPYLIETTDDLDQLAQRVNGGTDFTGRYFLLVNDLSYDGTENDYTPVGGYQADGVRAFNGTFLGDGHAISGINVKRDEDGVGVFGAVGQEGRIYDLRVRNCSFSGDRKVGSIAGVNLGHIERCLVIDGDVQGSEYAGRVVGYNERWLHYNYYTAEGLEGIGGNGSATQLDNVFGGHRGYAIGCTNSIDFQYVESPGTGLTYNAVLECDGILYAPSGVTVRIGVASKGGATITVLKCNGEVLTPGEDGGYQFTMPAADVLISATLDVDSLTLLDNADNTEILSANEGKTTNVILQGRTLWKDGYWNTICLPFSLSANDLADEACPLHGASIKALSGAKYQDGVLSLSFSDASSIEAGKPYIVRWDADKNKAGIANPLFRGVTIDNAVCDVTAGSVTFVGTYGPVTLTADDKTSVYLGTGDKFYHPTSVLAINSFRGFFRVGGESQPE